MNKLLTKVIILLSIVAIIGIGFIIYLFIGNSQSGDNGQDNQQPKTPSEVGRSIAINIVNNDMRKYEEITNTYNDFITKINNNEFDNRDIAINYLNTQLTEIENRYTSYNQEINEYYNQTINNFGNDNEKYNAFMKGYNETLKDQSNNNDLDTSSLKAKSDTELLKLKPAAPNADKLVQDVIGKNLREDSHDGYFHSTRIEIVKDGTTTATITNSNITALHATYYATITNRRYTGGVFYFDLKLEYSYSESKDKWILDNIVCIKIMPEIKGGRIGTISKSHTNLIDNYYLTYTNNTSDDVVVGGRLRDICRGNEWVKFAHIIPAYGSKRIDTLVPENEIEFVELL